MVKEKLIALNRYSVSNGKSYRFVIALDNTPSMEGVLEDMVKITSELLTRTQQVLDELPEMESVRFDMQIALFNDYPCPAESVLITSSFESQPNRLVAEFIPKIKIIGGDCPPGPDGIWDPQEAIELVMQHTVEVCKEHEKGTCQLILITDAGIKTKDAVIETRKIRGEEYWFQHKGAATCVDEQIPKFQAMDITCNTFYPLSRARVDLQRIADATGGQNKAISKDSNACNELLESIILPVIKKIAGERGVAKYKAKFGAVGAV